MDTIRIIHKKKGQQHLFYLREKVRGKWLPRGAFYPEVGWRSWSILSRGERQVPMLQLQYQFGRQSVYFRTETGRGKSIRTLQDKTANKQMVVRGLPVKNRILYTIK